MESASLARRVALTLGLPLILFLGERVPAPGVDTTAFAEVLEADGVKNVSLFALGLAPAVSAYLLTEFAALVVPKWRALRHSWPKGRAKLERAAFFLTIALAAFQAFGVAMMLHSMPVEPSPLPNSVARVLFTLTIVAGPCVLLLVAGAISRQGLMNGIVLLILVADLEQVARLFFLWIAGADAMNVAHEHVPVVASLVLIALASFVALSDRPPAASPWLAVPSSSLHPLAIALGVLALPTALAGFDVFLPSELAILIELPRSRLVLLLSLTLAAALGLAFLFNRPASVARWLASVLEDGSTIAEDRWEKRVRSALRASLLPAGLLLSCIAITQTIVEDAVFTGAIVLTLVIAALIDLVRALSLWARKPNLVCVWEERRPYAVAAIRELLGRAGIEAHALDSTQTAVYRIFAPYVATRIYVEPREKHRATELLRDELARDEREASVAEGVSKNGAAVAEAPGARPVPDSPAWTLRVRNPFLAVALAGVVLCWAFASSEARDAGDATNVRPVSLEFVAVDDRLDPFAKLDPSTLPAGAARLNEYLRNGDTMATRAFVRLVALPGESLEQAKRRVEPWWRGLGLPPDARVGWEKAQESSEETAAQEVTLRSYILRGGPILTGWDIARAEAETHGRAGASIRLTLNPSGAERFERFTRENVGSRLAIVLDGAIQSAPVIQGAIPGGIVSISLGSESVEKDLAYARSLARSLSAPPKDARTTP